MVQTPISQGHFRICAPLYHGVKKVCHGVRKVSHGVRKVYRGVRKVYHGVRKVYHGVRKVYHGVRKVYHGHGTSGLLKGFSKTYRTKVSETIYHPLIHAPLPPP